MKVGLISIFFGARGGVCIQKKSKRAKQEGRCINFAEYILCTEYICICTYVCMCVLVIVSRDTSVLDRVHIEIGLMLQ